MGDLARVEGVGAELAQPSVVREQIKSLKKTVDECYLELGQLLYEVEVHGWWKGWGFKTYKDYVEREVGFGKSKANYLVRVYTELRIKCGISKVALTEVEWTKARVITRVATTDNATRWVEKAKGMTREELECEVKHYEWQKKKASPPLFPKQVKSAQGSTRIIAEVEFHRFSCGLTDEQDEDVTNALQKARQVAGPDRSRGHLLQLISLEFMSGYLEQTNARAWVRWMLSRIEKQFGLRVIASDAGTGEVIFGEGRKRPEGDKL